MWSDYSTWYICPTLAKDSYLFTTSQGILTKKHNDSNNPNGIAFLFQRTNHYEQHSGGITDNPRYKFDNMERLTIWYFIVAIGVLAASCSQILLKKSAIQKHSNLVSTILNKKVISAYIIFFGSFFINVYAMSQGVLLKDLPILESLGYAFVPLLSVFLLHETLSKRTICAILLILSGITIFYI